MGSTTEIAWADATWNPVTGCRPLTEGCANCYAARYARRNIGDFRGGRPFSDVREHLDRLSVPSRWKRPRRVFLCSMGDLFEFCVTDVFIHAVFQVMAAVPRHTFMVLTKRPNFARLSLAGRVAISENVWIGVTVENQRVADYRVRALSKIPAPHRFLSCEPLLGPLSLDIADSAASKDEIGWVIAGCETGPGRRDGASLDDYRRLRDECRARRIPFFVKQLDIGGKVSKHPDDWPADLRIREIPQAAQPAGAASTGRSK